MEAMATEKIYAFRLKPGEDLRNAIDAMVKEKNISAGWIITCTGSLSECKIRFADRQEGTIGLGHFEIVSLVGTVSINGTAEIVLGATSAYEFARVRDDQTGWNELEI